jgi:hypothetical protein
MREKAQGSPTMAATCPPIVASPPNVTFDDNFQEWSMMLGLCLDSQRLWGHLTSHSPCPDEPTTEVDGARQPISQPGSSICST